MSKNTFNLKENRNYKFRIYPNKGQEQKLKGWLETCRILYNSAVADRKNHYERNDKGLSRTAQQVTLKADKAKYPQVKEVHSQPAQEVLFRVERAFNNFYRRVKAGEKPGYPRYKGSGQYKSLTFTQFGDGLGASFINGKLKLSKIGLVKIKLHREIFGEVKTLQRGLTRKKKGSKNRAKARVKLAGQHEKVRNQRRDFHHKVSTQLVKRYGKIVVEDLQIPNMLKNHHLAKSISDAGWGEFISMLTYKAESAGRIVEKVSPCGTTQECSRCGNVVKKDLSVRTHNCAHCGLVLDRDHNAAINILQKAKIS